MASNLSLRSLLDSEKLMGSNFDNWYRKLKIVLEYERILCILTDLASEKSAPNARGTVRDTYQKWLNDHAMMRCIMRDDMNDEFSCKFKDAQPEEMIQKLN